MDKELKKILTEKFGITEKEIVNAMLGISTLESFDYTPSSVETISGKLKDLLFPVLEKVTTVSASELRDLALRISLWLSGSNSVKRKLAVLIKDECLRVGFMNKQAEDLAFAFYQPSKLLQTSFQSSKIELNGKALNDYLVSQSIAKILAAMEGKLPEEIDVVEVIKRFLLELFSWMKILSIVWYDSYTQEQIERKVNHVRQEYLMNVKVFGAKNALEKAKEQMNNFI